MDYWDNRGFGIEEEVIETLIDNHYTVMFDSVGEAGVFPADCQNRIALGIEEEVEESLTDYPHTTVFDNERGVGGRSGYCQDRSVFRNKARIQ